MELNSMSWGTDLGGLNLDREGDIPVDEWTAFAQAHGGPLGYPEGLPALRLFNEFRPDLVRTHRINMRHNGPHVPGIGTSVPFIPADLHVCLLDKSQYGVELEIFVARYYGWTREEVFDVIGVATLDTLSEGLEYACTPKALEILRNWPDSNSDDGRFPSHWDKDLSVMTSGIDLTNPGMSEDEFDQLRSWYLRISGEVPPWLAFVGGLAPDFIKTQRLRWERALRVSPPAALPFYRLHYAVKHGQEDAIRENTLLGRGLGMTERDIVDTIIHGLLMSSGPANSGPVRRAIGDILNV
jgi:hypothetical protein